MILTACKQNSRLRDLTLAWASAAMTDICMAEINTLTNKAAGMHFNARRATCEKLEEFDLVEIAAKMRTHAPYLWQFLRRCLEARPSFARRRKARRRRQRVSESEREYWEDMEPLPLPEDPDDADEHIADSEESTAADISFLVAQKQAVCIAILAQSTHQRCNALQSVIGMFLHSCRAPEATVELLSRVGLSISRSAIDDAVSSLSRESAREMKTLGRTRLVSVAYDNFDVELKTSVPTVDKPHENLAHLTSGTFIRLEHGVTANDLRCSDEVWKTSPNNPMNHGKPTQIDWMRFTNLHPETPHPSGLTRRQRFHKFIFLRDLLKYGPAYFAKFQGELEEPETVDAIPVVKSRQVPAHAMDVNQSSVDGNIEALTDLFQQLGWGEKPETSESAGQVVMDDYVV
ncbi:hypothetical protein FOMPIDRAFT_49843, partial [Fomitopsis schrenkii]